MDGLLVVDKPAGMTSHDVVDRVRKVSQMRRIGHTGTLDPFATGVIVLCLGRATRLSQYLCEADKSYLANARLGEQTDTQDLTGEVTASRSPASVSRDQLEACMGSFRGVIEQVPPMFSAKRKSGVRLYELARQGEEVSRDPVQVRIERLELVRFDSPDFEFDVECSKGTYIRTLAADIGNELGCGAHLRALRRTRNGRFGLESSTALDRLVNLEGVRAALLPMDQGLADSPMIRLESGPAQAFCCGQQVVPEQDLPQEGALVRVYYAEEFLGLGRVHPDMVLQPLMVLANPSQCA